ncbi:MAG TPA: hypothetical protein VGG41_10220 [Solirubrobacteraceae bacterium]|jgi:hypothetical protein
MAWIAGGVVLAGGTFGTFAMVEAGMASAAPSRACTVAQQSLSNAQTNLLFIEEFGSILSLEGPYARAQVAHLISNAEQQVSAAEQAVSRACTVITPTMSMTPTFTQTQTQTITITRTTAP